MEIIDDSEQKNHSSFNVTTAEETARDHDVRLVGVDRALAFLALLYGEDTPGDLPIFQLPSQHTHWFEPTNEPKIRRFLERVDHKHLYFSTCLHSRVHAEMIWKKEHPKGPFAGRGTNESAVCMPGVFGDFDIVGEGHKSEKLPLSKEEILAWIATLPIAPSLVWDSGHGIQAAWLFREPWLLNSDEERQEALCFRQSWKDVLHACVKEQWKFDNVSDLARVLRLPGGWNWKSNPPLPVVFLEDSGLRYNPSDLQELFSANGHTHSNGHANGAANGAMTKEERARILADLRDALPSIPAIEYETWLRVGMGLHSVDTSEVGFDEWVEWSKTCPEKFDLDACRKRWRSFHNDGGITHGTIFDLAIKHGWRARANGAVHGTVQAPFSLTDTGNAQRLATRHGLNIRYVHTWKTWIIWDGKRWQRDTSGAIYQLAKETARAIAIEETKDINDDKRFKELLQWSRQSLNQTRLRAMVDLAQSEPGIPVQIDDLDRNPWLFNVQNGTVDLKTCQCREHRRDDLITKISPAFYDTTATCPTWVKFLQRIFCNDDKLIEYIRRAVGYSLSGSTGEECLFFLHGSGRNGKTKLLETIAALVGDYGKPTPFSTFLDKTHDSVSNDVAALRGARFVTAVEVNEGRRLNESLIKNMTGGDRISARFLFSEFFEFTPVFKLWLAANAKPVVRETTGAIWERIKLIPFTVTIPPEDRDKHLLEKLTAELSGILLWAIEGAYRWQREGLPMPDKIKDATANYRKQMDVLGSFIEERCETDDTYIETVTTLFNAYQEWCKSSGEDAISKKAFGMRLEERGFLPDRNRMIGRFWRGIRLFLSEA